jgi:hypothetical protein
MGGVHKSSGSDFKVVGGVKKSQRKGHATKHVGYNRDRTHNSVVRLKWYSSMECQGPMGAPPKHQTKRDGGRLIAYLYLHRWLQRTITIVR